jgi:LPS export ABC transporter protein LptC
VTYRIFAVLTIVIVIVGSIMLAREQGQTPTATTVQRSGWNEGYSARNATLVQTAADGRPLYTLDASTIRQEPNGRQVQLENVRMRFHDASGHDWTASAEHGRLGRDSGVVELSDDVHLSGTASDIRGPAEITTPKLRYDTRTEVATTREPVTLLWPGCRLDAVGLVADLKDRRVQLESSVHGICAQ